MRLIECPLPGVAVLEPTVFRDARGFFFESYNRSLLRELTGFDGEFVQDNHTSSVRNVRRGLHYQVQQPQGKLVRVVQGEVYDVVVDLRRSSTHFGKWAAVRLSEHDKRMLWVPPGFAHGFLVLSDTCQFLYKVTDYWAPAHERCLRWNDPALAIDWPLTGEPIVSAKDAAGQLLAEAEVYP